MDTKPKIADKKPLVIELEAGTYFWCACGESKKQPYCDGSHSGTGFSPIAFTLEEKKRVALCLCKRSAKSPFCDGAHKTL
jgi:CDGSH-type Zn-finger protein